MRNFFLTRYRKQKKHLANMAMAVAAAAGLAAGSAQATPITIVNAGFETNDGTGGASYGQLTAGNNPNGWISATGNGNAGYISYGRGHSGSTYAGFAFTNHTLTQVIVGSNLDAGTYTLSGFGRIANGTGGDVTIAILNGNDVLGSQQTTGLTETYVSLTPLVLNLPTTINSPITIKVTGGTVNQTNVDDFSLNFVATPTPEPNSLIILGLGSIGAMRLVRRRQT